VFLSPYPDHTDDYEPESFRELENWIEMIKETEAARNRVVPRILVGNKVDLTEGIVVDVSTARAFLVSLAYARMTKILFA
jgi:GTPase SAR1 family protein